MSLVFSYNDFSQIESVTIESNVTKSLAFEHFVNIQAGLS